MSALEPEAPASTPPPPPPTVSEPPIPQPPTEADPASVPAVIPKPLLNPLQADGPAPASTVVEPPRSPNPANPATNDQGNTIIITEAVNGNLQPETSSIVPSAPSTPALVTDLAAKQEEPSQSPLPPDATVPPTPRAEDEAPPALPAGAIPSAVPTPSVITTEEQEKQGGILGVEEPSLPTPAPEESAPPAPVPEAAPASDSAPAPVVEEAQPAPEEEDKGGEPMDVDVDAKGEEETPVQGSIGLQASASDGSLKRTGDSLEAGREEKRMKEESPAVNGAPASAVTPIPAAQAPSAPSAVAPSSTPAPAPAPAPASDSLATVSETIPAAPADAPPPAWLSYEPPAPRPSGPTTPLTQHQHKHLLNAVRGLKKRQPDASFFAQPVDTVLFNIPHYPQIIETPMDLGTVETKLIVSDPRGPPKDKSKMAKWDTSKGAYKNYSEVVTDVRTIWENSRKFNGKEHGVTQAADRLDSAFETALSKIPPEPTPAVATPPTPVAAAPAAAGPSARRASISQPPVIRRTSDDARPKREIHPPPPKDLAYEEPAGAARKPKRRNDPQLQWANRTIKSLEISQKYYTTVQPFLYPVEQIIEQLPDYKKFIKRPIDLNHITEKFAANAYEEFQQVDDDIRLMLSNAMKFNPPGHEVNTAANHFLQIWEEKLVGLPAKQEAREESEDPLAEEFVEPGYSSEEDNTQLRSLEAQVSSLESQIATLRAKIAKRRATKAAKPAKAKAPKAGPSQRKQSVAKQSPGVNGNGHAPTKKSKKTKEVAQFKDEDEDMDSDDEPTSMTLTQKQELAEKIQVADADILQKAITIIQQTTNLGANNEEIELDIDSLPQATVVKLYNLVCRGGKTGKRAKQGSAKKASKKATGGASRKSVNEREEAERIKRMEAQLQSFDARGNAAGAYEGEESSSEEESSEEE
ncbi:hypothetical protein IAT40_001139 [Kwoniella sp. CBS 6097]